MERLLEVAPQTSMPLWDKLRKFKGSTVTPYCKSTAPWNTTTFTSYSERDGIMNVTRKYLHILQNIIPPYENI
jgi:hypothetical protein